MIRADSILVSLVKLVDQLSWPPEPDKRPRGCPKRYSDRLILKALIIMIIRRLYSAYALLRFLEQDDPIPIQLRPLLVEQGRFPSRRTWERRLAKLPDTLPALIGYNGRHLVCLLKPWTHQGRAVSFDSTALATGGGGWHKKHRDLGEIPHSSIDTEAGWSKSGWHGWWYGWKLHLLAPDTAVRGRVRGGSILYRPDKIGLRGHHHAAPGFTDSRSFHTRTVASSVGSALSRG